MLSAADVEHFIEQGFVRVPQAFPRSTADAACDILWRMAGVDPRDPSAWHRPVIRIEHAAQAPFAEAANAPRLRSAFDQLVGAGRWLPRAGLGTFPIRFPHAGDPGDDWWHVDGSYRIEGNPGYGLNLRSRGRALLMLFLFTDVRDEDAPTRLQVGSHLEVPRFLAPAGEAGLSTNALCEAMQAARRLEAVERPVAHATGDAGDVFLCHPFLIHAAQRHRGSAPRIIAQPELQGADVLDWTRPADLQSPVELAIGRGLARFPA